jgi:hypothetical protein
MALDNPLFPVAVGGIAFAAVYFINEARCECNKRNQKRIEAIQTTGGHKDPLLNPFTELKEVLHNAKVELYDAVLVKIEQGIHGSHKFIYKLPNGQLKH